MQKMELDWGFGQDTGIDLPDESPGTIPTRAVAVLPAGRTTRTPGQNWCKNGSAERLATCSRSSTRTASTGGVWEPGQAAIAAIGQGYVTVTPLQLADAYVALANGGTLYSPRIGEALVSPSGQVVQKINPPVVRHAAGLRRHAVLHPRRAGRRGHPGHRGRRVLRLPAQ